MNLPATFSIVLAILAIGLIFRGRKRRAGADPHCRKCNYLLHGLTSDRCPECGAMLSPLAIVYGERRRRIGSFLFGWVLLLGLGALVAPGGFSALEQVDWYQHEPMYFVFRDLNSRLLATRERAWAELMRRYSAGMLSADRRDRLVDFALALQANAVVPSTPLDYAAIAYLGTRLAAGDLSAPQRKKLCEQSMTLVQFSVRPKVIAGDPVPYLIAYKNRGPNNLWARLTTRNCAVDGQTTEFGGSYTESGGMAGGAETSYISCPPVGKHELNLIYRIEYYFQASTASPPGQIGPVLDTLDGAAAAKFEVVSKQAGLSIQPIFDPKLAAAMKATISLGSFRYSVSNRWIEGMIHFNNLPANVAFDVFAQYDGKRQSLGPVTAIANSGGYYYQVMGDENQLPPASIEIILLPSRIAASRTVSMLSYWNQEIDFPNVPVSPH